MSIVDRVRDLVTAVLEAESAELYDVEHNGGVLRVLVDAEGGIGIDDLKRISRAVSRRLDETDPIPGRYTLEVSSPGLERPLRTPEHFRRAVGESVKVKTVPTPEGARRLNGTLLDADEGGFDLRTDEDQCRLRYDEVLKARTVFVWGPTPPPGSRRSGDSASRTKPTRTKHSTTTNPSNDREVPAS